MSKNIENSLGKIVKEEFRELYVSKTTRVLMQIMKESPEIFTKKTFSSEQLAKNIANKLADEVLEIF